MLGDIKLESIDLKKREQFKSYLESNGVDFMGYRLKICPVCGGNNCAEIYPGGKIHCFKPDCKINFHGTLDIDEYIAGFGDDFDIEAQDLHQIKVKMEKEIVVDKKLNHDIYSKAIDFFHDELMEGGREYKELISRGRTDESLKHFKVGVIKNSDKLYNRLKNNYTDDQLEDCGLYKYSNDGTPRIFAGWNSYCFPVYWKGKLRDIKIKSVDKDGKKFGGYIGNRFSGYDFPRFLNSEALSKGGVVIVEGENDCMRLWEMGKKNTVAVLGGVSDKQLNHLKNIRDEKFYSLCFDNDIHGELYTDKFIDEFKKVKKHSVNIVTYDGDDPDVGSNFDFEGLTSEAIQSELKKAHDEKIKDEYKEDLDKFILNYYIKDGQKIPKDIIDSSMDVDTLATFVDGSGKKYLFDPDNPGEFIASSAMLYVILMQKGTPIKFIPGSITETKYIEYCRLMNKNNYQRFSCLSEKDGKSDTLYKVDDIKPKNTGMFRKLVETITLSDEKDRYRFAAGMLSGFLNSYFDGIKPLFSVIANSASSGKTSATVNPIDIIQNMGPLLFDGSKKDEEQLAGIKGLSNKYVLYDNLQYTTKEQMLNITRAVTDRELSAWFMNISHCKVRNNKTFWATFNSEEAFNTDILNRVLVINMADGRNTTEKEKINISKKLDIIKNHREELLADILWIMQQTPTTNYNIKEHVKFSIWSEEISKHLSVVFPEIEEFDFSLSDEDKALDADSNMFKEFIEEITRGRVGVSVFIPNDELVDKYREFFKNDRATKTSIARHINNKKLSFPNYEIHVGKLKSIGGNKMRGLEVNFE